MEGPSPITKRSGKRQVRQSSIMPSNHEEECSSRPTGGMPVEHPSPTTTRNGKRRIRQNSIIPRNHSTNEGGKEESFLGSSVRMFLFSHSNIPLAVFSDILSKLNTPSRILFTEITMMKCCREPRQRGHPSSVVH